MPHNCAKLVLQTFFTLEDPRKDLHDHHRTEIQSGKNYQTPSRVGIFYTLDWRCPGLLSNALKEYVHNIRTRLHPFGKCRCIIWNCFLKYKVVDGPVE